MFISLWPWSLPKESKILKDKKKLTSSSVSLRSYDNLLTFWRQPFYRVEQAMLSCKIELHVNSFLKDWRESVSQRGDLTKLLSINFFKQKENNSRRKMTFIESKPHITCITDITIQLNQIWILSTWLSYEVTSCDVPSSGTFRRCFWCCHVSPFLFPFSEKIPSSDPRLPVKKDMLFSFLFFTCYERWS